MRSILRMMALALVLSLLSGCAFFEDLLEPLGLIKPGSDDEDDFVSPYDEPQVFCAYFHYFRTDNYAQWFYPGRDPGSILGPEPWRRHIWIGRAGDYPYIGAYDNVRDAEIMRWHIQLAKAAGIRAFLLYVYDWQDQEAETQLLLDVAAQEGFKIGFVEHSHDLGARPRSLLDGRAYPIMFEKYSNHDEVMASYSRELGLPVPEETTRYIKPPSSRKSRVVPEDALKLATDRVAAMLNRWKTHPAYLRIDNKPIILLPYVDEHLEPQDFKNITERLEQNVHEDLYVVALVPQVYWYFYPKHVPYSGITEAWAEAGADAFTHWTPNGMVTETQKVREEVTKFNVRNSVEWGKDPMIPAMPGFNDDDWRPGDSPAPNAPRRNGEAWREQLEAIMEAKPRFVFIQAWNEWHEGSQIEPSTYYSDPYLYLKILANALGHQWSTPPLPPRSSIDPVRVNYLPY